MKRLFLIPLSIAALFASGCSTPSTPSTPSASSPAPVASESPTPPKIAPTVFEGVWKGREVTPGRDGSVSLTVSGQNLEFHGSDADDWLKGTFTLREDTNPKQWNGIVTDCAATEYIGKKCRAIYKIEDGTLMIAGNQPGDLDIPQSFDAPGARQFVFKHEQ